VGVGAFAVAVRLFALVYTLEVREKASRRPQPVPSTWRCPTTRSEPLVLARYI